MERKSEGGLKSKDAVIRFEHYMYLCQRRDFDESARGRFSFSNVEVHVLMSDATNEDSVDKSKVTVGFVWCTAACGDAIQRYEDAEGELQAEQHFSCADLQDVHTGTVVETLKIERQLQSVSCPTWREDAPARTHRIIVLVVDSAANTILAGKMIRRMFRPAKWATSAVLVLPCLLHQFSLSTLGFCAVLGAWKFSGESEGQDALGLSAIASAWRSPGLAKKIYHTVASRFSEQVANDVARKVLGSVIQTRWGSMKDIEKIVFVAGEGKKERTFGQFGAGGPVGGCLAEGVRRTHTHAQNTQHTQNTSHPHIMKKIGLRRTWPE